MKSYVGSPARVTEMAKALFREERALKRLDGWFLMKESNMRHEAEYKRLLDQVQIERV